MIIINGVVSDGNSVEVDTILAAIEGMYDSSAVVANVDGNILERLEGLSNEISGNLPYYLRQSEDVSPNPDVYASFFVNILSSNGTALPLDDININDINIRLEKSASGGAYSIAGITQPTLNKLAGQVYTTFVLQSSEGWDVNCTYRLTLSSVKITVGVTAYTLQTFVWNNTVSIAQTIDGEIDALTVKLAKPSQDSADDNTVAEVIGTKADTTAGTSLVSRTKQVIADLSALGIDVGGLDTKLDAISGYIDTEVAAIKVETDKIPATIAKVDAIKVETDKIPATIIKIDGEVVKTAAIKTETDKIPATITKIDNIKTETDKIPAEVVKTAAIKTETDKIPATITKIDNIKTETDQIGTLVNTGGIATIGAAIGDTSNVSIATRLTTIAAYIDTEIAAIKAETDQIGTIVNTTGVATIGAVLGDAAGTSIVARLTTIASYIDTEVAAIKVMTDKIGTVTNTGGTATIGAILGNVANVSIATRLTTIAGYIDTEIAAIKTETDKIPATITKIDGEVIKTSAIKTETDKIQSIVDAINAYSQKFASIRKFLVTTAFVANEVITFTTGAGGTAGVTTVSGDSMVLSTSAALFNADPTSQVFLNGVRQRKGVDFIWDSTGSGHFVNALNVGNYFEIERIIP